MWSLYSFLTVIIKPPALGLIWKVRVWELGSGLLVDFDPFVSWFFIIDN